MQGADWDIWLRTWQIHGETEGFKRKLRRAVEIAQEGAERRRMFCAMSGGKDGSALAGVLCAAGLREKIPLVYCHTDLNTPGMEETAYGVAEKLDMDLEVIEPEFPYHADVWDLLRSLPSSIDITDERNHSVLGKACAAGNMLVAYQYEHGYSGSYSGMRAEESRGRRMNRKIRGPLYQIKKDGSWMCLPIVDWTARDVFAWLVRLGLPICAHYRLLNEAFGISPESPASRVDCVITNDYIAGMGSIAHVKRLYPALWSKLIRTRPELGRMT